MVFSERVKQSLRRGHESLHENLLSKLRAWDAYLVPNLEKKLQDMLIIKSRYPVA